MLRLLKMPKNQVALTLFLIFITAFIRESSVSLLFRFVSIVVLSVCVDITLLKLRKIKPFFPSAGIVSALIIILLLAPDLSLIELTLTLILAIFAKHFIRVDKKHIFNPAALGLFLGGLIFSHDVSWWAVSFQQLTTSNVADAINNKLLLFSFLILILPGYVSCIKMRRYKIVVSFLLSYGLFSYFLTKNITILDPTVLFFSLVMLPEPMTTPSNPSKQILFGIFVALVSLLVSYPILNLIPDPLITALLVGNIVFFKRR